MSEGEVRRSLEQNYPPTGPTGDPGWYPDPSIPGGRRWWNGTIWTTAVHADGVTPDGPSPDCSDLTGLQTSRSRWARAALALGLMTLAGALAYRFAPLTHFQGDNSMICLKVRRGWGWLEWPGWLVGIALTVVSQLIGWMVIISTRRKRLRWRTTIAGAIAVTTSVVAVLVAWAALNHIYTSDCPLLQFA